MEKEPLLEKIPTKGGLKACILIIGNDAVEKIATFALIANVILYLMEQYHMEMATASNIFFLWSSATNLTPIVGAFIADSYSGRFYAIGFGSVTYLSGTILLWSTSVIPQARPPPCDQDSCIPPTLLQSLFLCVSLGLIAIGAGGIRSSSLAFGANQLENEENCGGVSERYFSWYYASYNLSCFIGLTCVVYIQDNVGWNVGFAVSIVLVMIGNCLFFLGSPLYVKVQTKPNLLAGFVQVVAASYKNRRFKDATNLTYHYKNDQIPGLPSEKFRFLNKACVVTNPEKELLANGRAADEWSLCTAEQVEEVKALFRVIPIWSTGAILFVNLSQTSFQVLQASSMDRRITSDLVIPAASLGLFSVISVLIWITVYDRVFLPVASRIVGRPVHVSTITRMGLGIFLSFVSTFVTAGVESMRLGRAKGEEGLEMSALWLVPQYCLTGFATVASDVAQMEFYLSELPRSMAAVAANLDGLGITVGNLVAGLVMNVVDGVSRMGGGKRWISSDINEGHYDYYFLVLTGLNLVNMVYYLVCVRAYGPLKEEKTLEDDL